MPRRQPTTAARAALAGALALAAAALLAGCDTGDGKTLRRPTAPPPTSTTTTTIAGAGPIETAAALVPTTPVPPVGMRVLAPWADGGPIGAEYTCDGVDQSPPVSWTAVPDGTTELAVVLVDLDATGDDGRSFVHWLVTGIDPSVSSFAAGRVPPGASEHTTSFGEVGYGGPCPPEGESHRYELTVHALNQAVDAADEVPAAEVIDQIVQRSIASATVVGTYSR